MSHHRIVKGDVVKVVSSLFVGDYFDACLCDPPYLLQFMGKEFDKQHTKMRGANEGQKMQAWHERWTREVLRVLKPGAHMLAFGGTRTYHRLASAVEDAGFEVRDTLCWLHGQGFPKNKDTQLKPAVEPCVLAKKPGSTGKLNIDGCRIGTDPSGWGGKAAGGNTWNKSNSGLCRDGEPTKSVGRWPANLILSHHESCNEVCRRDCPVRMLDEQSGITRSVGGKRSNKGESNRNAYAEFAGDKETANDGGLGDVGGASRFFYCAKVSPRERNLGGIDCQHPTLKPIALTTYLARLLLPPARLKPPRRLLVPFSGAGSEIIGALFAGWDEIWGIEQDPEYIADAEARIAARHELAKPKG